MTSQHRNSNLESAFEDQVSRFIVGIDLGTTNCAVAWIDMEAAHPSVETWTVEQMVDWSLVERRDTLPSFHYQLTPQEAASIKHKWIEGGESPYVIGVLARDRGLQMPGRQIASAKSWLCHAGVDRTAPMLPWHGDEDVQSLSPVAASAAYLRHIRTHWNSVHRNDLLENQDVVITLPASFDEIARELTIEAAKDAGLPNVILLEEPQAAFYAWLQRHGEDWSSTIKPGQSVLVCDIGGGTTDLTLIRVKGAKGEGDIESRASYASESPSDPLTAEGQTNEASKSKLHRVAVGQHLILGGDNLDMALAKAAEEKMVGSGKLTPREWDSLRLHCRVAKETLLGDQPPAEYVITLTGSGSKLIQQAKSVSIDLEMVRRVLLDGFFPSVEIQDRPVTTTTGFQEFGLPYAQDPAVTRHLASFLWDHRHAGRDEEEIQSMSDLAAARPDFLLFNGGVLEAKQIRSRLIEQIESWFASTATSEAPWGLKELEGNRLDLAVAHGAAYFGLVRRGIGIRIDASLARSYYLQISYDPPQALCLVPGDTQAGDRVRLGDHPFRLMLGQPVQFPLWVSSIRLTDPPGSVVDIDTEQMKPMPPIRTVLESARHRKMEPIPVIAEAELTEIGTLHLSCVLQDDSQRWKLDFDIRSSVETNREAHLGEGELAGIVSEDTLALACKELERAFGPSPDLDPKNVIKSIASATQMARSEWPPSLLRGMWNRLIELDDGRRHSSQHEARWLNLVGYFLRPGFGYAADDWRVATTWRRVQGKLQYRTGTSSSEAIILWRRIAGGFTPGQQQAIYQEIYPRLKGLLASEGKGTASLNTNEAVELLRLCGSLELLPLSERSQLGKWILASLHRKKMAPLIPSMLWTLGRIGSRVPIYGPIHQLIVQSQVESWIEALMKHEANPPEKSFAIMQMARKTGDRYRDVSESCRSKVLDWMAEQGVAEAAQQRIREVGELTTEQRMAAFGESMPLGLQLERIDK